MIYDLSNVNDQYRFKEYVNTLYKARAVVDLKKHRKLRSDKQNRYLHLLCNYFAAMHGVSAADAKYEFYKKTCNRDLYIEVKRNSQGKVVHRTRSSTELNTEQMALSITRFRNWSVMVAGIYLPSANEEKAILEAEKLIEENKEFVLPLE